MICKHCGKSIDPNQKTCPHCGYAIESSEKGNGFWDMAAPPQPKVHPVTQQKTVTTSINTPKASSQKTLYLLIAVGALAVCSIVLSVVLFAISNRKIDQNKYDLSKSISSTREDLSQTISSSKQNTDEQVNALSESFGEEVASLSGSIDSLRSDMDEVKGTEPSILRIISSPIDRELDEGYISDDGTYLFIVEVQGPVASFKWEMQSPLGTWTTIEFDSTYTNTVLGLMLQEDVSQGYSRLAATGLTLDAAGTYKCIIASADGVEKELYVHLTILETEPTPEPSPEPSENAVIATPEPEEGKQDDNGADATPAPTKSSWWGR